MAYIQFWDSQSSGIAEFGIIREVDKAFVPNDPENADWLAFEAWLAEGNEPASPPARPLSIPGEISDRQFAQVLALDGVITKAEAKAWAARGDLPDRLEEVLLEIPEEGDQRFAAEMLLSSATTYERDHPLVPTLGALLGYDAAALDDLWTRGAAL